MSAPESIGLTQGYKAVVTRVDAAKAADFLRNAVPNRPISRYVVDGYKTAMISGRWLPAIDPIHIDEHGKLINGRHRLTAVFETECEQDFLIVYGVPRASMAIIDTGRKRSLSDTLSMRGAKNTSLLAAVVSLAWSVDTFPRRSTVRGHLTNDIGEALYEADRDAFDTAVALTLRHRLGFMTSTLTGWLAYVTDAESCDWTERVSKGVDLQPRTGAAALHARIVTELGRKTVLKFNEAFLLIVKAYLADRRGRAVNTLKMALDETPPDLGSKFGPRLGRNKHPLRKPISELAA